MISLMTFLYRNNNKWLKFTDLAMFIKVSKKTLHTYLDKLQNMFINFSEFSYAGAMVRVKIDPNFGLLTMQRIFYSQNLAIRGLKMTFFDPSIHKFDLSIELDVSESSIYRSIKSFNEDLLSAYDLQFSYSDLAFKGEEVEIQKFYINFFIETNPDPSTWVFEDYFPEESANQLAREIGNYVQYPLYLAHFDYIKTALAVASIRLKQGYKIPLYGYKVDVLPKVKDFAKAPKVQAILNEEFPDYGGEPYQLVYQILAYFLHSDFFRIFLEPEDQAMEELAQTDHYRYFLDKVNYLCSKYRLKLDKPHAVYYQMYAYFKFKLSSVDATDFFLNHSEYILSYMKFFNLPFYEDLTKILQDYLNLYHPESKYEIQKLAYTVLTLWPDLLIQLMVKKGPVKALIISRFDYFYGRTLRDMLKLTISYSMDIEVYQEYEIDYQKIREGNYDLIIADYVIKEDLGDALVYSFEQLPTIDRVQDLFKAIAYRDIQSTIDNHPQEFLKLGQILGYISKYS